MGAILTLSKEEVAANKLILLGSMFSTFLGAAYIMMDANFTLMKSKRISNPGESAGVAKRRGGRYFLVHRVVAPIVLLVKFPLPPPPSLLMQ